MMFKILIESVIRDRFADIYEKMAALSSGVATLSEKMVAVIDGITENKNKIALLMEMHTQLLEMLAEQHETQARSGIPTLADLLNSHIDDDDLPN